MKVIFATQNANKVKEIQVLLDQSIQLQSLLDLNYTEELEETQETLQGNALQKARFVFKKFGLPCFADDTGLEVEALNGEPGVYSARYGGEEKKADENIDLLQKKLKGISNKASQFRTVIAYIDNEGKEHLFEGVCKGKIIEERRGEKGFGYDPVFIPEGYSNTFAEMDLKVKSEISHRGRAVKKLVEFLNQK